MNSNVMNESCLASFQMLVIVREGFFTYESINLEKYLGVWGLYPEKVSKIVLSRKSENALLRSRKTYLYHLSSFWDGKYNSDLQSYLQENKGQDFDLQCRDLIVSEWSQTNAKIIGKYIGIHFV